MCIILAPGDKHFDGGGESHSLQTRAAESAIF